MNKVILIGRITRDPELRYSRQGSDQMAIARYTLAIDRRKTKANDNPGTDFVGCIAFGKAAEFAEKYFKKGTKIAVEGHIQTGSYEKDGRRVYTTDIVIENQEFAESKGKAETSEDDNKGDGFIDIPEGNDEDLPFE